MNLTENNVTEDTAAMRKKTLIPNGPGVTPHPPLRAKLHNGVHISDDALGTAEG